MPYAPAGPCREPGCPERAVERGRCAAHRVAPWSGSTPRSSRPWDRLRRHVLTRDEHRCYLCGAPADQVDHVVPRFEGGTDDPDNLAAICVPCHALKSAAEAKRAQHGGRPR